MPLRHVVLFRLHDTADDATVAEALRVLDGSRPGTGLLSWRVDESLDRRKGRVLLLDSTFADQRSFEDFRTSARHRAAGEHMARISDWLVGDVDVAR